MASKNLLRQVYVKNAELEAAVELVMADHLIQVRDLPEGVGVSRYFYPDDEHGTLILACNDHAFTDALGMLLDKLDTLEAAEAIMKAAGEEVASGQ